MTGHRRHHHHHCRPCPSAARLPRRPIRRAQRHAQSALTGWQRRRHRGPRGSDRRRTAADLAAVAAAAAAAAAATPIAAPAACGGGGAAHKTCVCASSALEATPRCCGVHSSLRCATASIENSSKITIFAMVGARFGGVRLTRQEEQRARRRKQGRGENAAMR